MLLLMMMVVAAVLLTCSDHCFFLFVLVCIIISGVIIFFFVQFPFLFPFLHQFFFLMRLDVAVGASDTRSDTLLDAVLSPGYEPLCSGSLPRLYGLIHLTTALPLSLATVIILLDYTRLQGGCERSGVYSGTSRLSSPSASLRNLHLNFPCEYVHHLHNYLLN